MSAAALPTAADCRRLLPAVVEPLTGYPYRLWGFGEGPALEAMVAAGLLTDRPALIDQAATLVRRSLEAPPSTLQADHTLPVPALLAHPALAQQPGLQQRMRAWTQLIRDAPRPSCAGPAPHRPDRDDVATIVWVDCLHTDGPGLAGLGLGEAAHAVLEESAAVLQSSDGLFHHGYDTASQTTNGVSWGRGCGWALLGLVGTLALHRSPDTQQRLLRLLAALAHHEVEGRWRTVVDDASAPMESSVSALVAWGLLAGLEAEVVDPGWRPLALRALAAAIEDSDAGVLWVSEATPVGGPDTYRQRQLGVYPWGQGPLACALACAMRLDAVAHR